MWCRLLFRARHERSEIHCVCLLCHHFVDDFGVCDVVWLGLSDLHADVGTVTSRRVTTASARFRSCFNFSALSCTLPFLVTLGCWLRTCRRTTRCTEHQDAFQVSNFNRRAVLKFKITILHCPQDINRILKELAEKRTEVCSLRRLQGTVEFLVFPTLVTQMTVLLFCIPNTWNAWHRTCATLGWTRTNGGKSEMSFLTQLSAVGSTGKA